MNNINELIAKLEKLDFKDMYMNDFFLTWEKSDDEIEAVFTGNNKHKSPKKWHNKSKNTSGRKL